MRLQVIEERKMDVADLAENWLSEERCKRCGAVLTVEDILGLCEECLALLNDAERYGARG